MASISRSASLLPLRFEEKLRLLCAEVLLPALCRLLVLPPLVFRASGGRFSIEGLRVLPLPRLINVTSPSGLTEPGVVGPL